MSMTWNEARKCMKSLMNVLIIKEGDKYRPAKDTSRQDAYRALYEIQEALGTSRIEREEALLENMQDLELAISALRPVSRERVEKAWRGEWIDCSNGWMCSRCENDNTYAKPFCPSCGAAMTDAAVLTVMDRLKVLKDE